MSQDCTYRRTGLFRKSFFPRDPLVGYPIAVSALGDPADMLERVMNSKATPLFVIAFTVITLVLVLSLLGFEQRFNILVILCAMLGLAPVLMFHVYRCDMKERNDAERALRESERRYRLLIEHSPDAIGVHERGRILYTNPAWAKLLGASDSNELIGKSVTEFFSPSSRTQVESIFGQLRGGDMPLQQRLIRKDGTPLDVEISAVPLFHEGRHTVQVVMRDITESKHAEQEMSEALQLAQQATRLKSEFLANMSHELRTPMNGVLGMADVLLTTTLTDEQREYAQIIHTSASSLMTLLSEILDLSRIEAGKIELESVPFDLRQIVTEACNLFSARAASKKLALSTSFDAQTPSQVIGDVARIRQVLNNLIDNAIKFTERGAIQIQVTCGGIVNGLAKLHFAVEDTGVGIPLDKQEIIFEKFEQVDSSITRKWGGTGLGLAICREFIQLMGGKIGVRSAPQAGSRFWFMLDLPATQVDFQELELNADEDRFHLHGTRVLVVEDNEVNQVVISRMLENLGCQVELASTGKQAVEKTSQSDYALVLMDVNLPEIDGFEATRQIRLREDKAKHLPIVAVTAHAMRGDRQRCLSAGMDDYMSKPIDIANIAKAVSTWAERAGGGVGFKDGGSHGPPWTLKIGRQTVDSHV